MSRRLPVPQTRHLVGRAAYELRLAAAYILSPESLSEIARSLIGEESAMQGFEAEGPAYELASADGFLNIRLEPEVFSLQTPGSQLGRTADPLHQILARLLTGRGELLFERVALEYFSAAPVEGQSLEELFTESVIDLVTDWDEAFTQALSGTWHRGHYTLQYGLKPVDKRTFYLSDAWVSASNVQALELEAVLGDLDEEGLRLLSWPITPQAMKSLEIEADRFAAELLVPMTSVRQSFLAVFGDNAINEACLERTDLLARKYSRAGISTEDEKRLAALTEKVRHFLPRVTPAAWQLVNDITGRMGEVQERTQKVRKKYGLSR